MPRPILGYQNKGKYRTLQTEPTSSVQSDYQLEARLRQKRSTTYVEQLRQLDVQGQSLDRNKLDELMKTIQGEFPDLPDVSLFRGIVAKCYLGGSYEVHTLSLSNSIIHHYKSHETLPDGMEKARGLAMNENYVFIEVYDDCIRAIKENGDVSVVKG